MPKITTKLFGLPAVLAVFILACWCRVVCGAEPNQSTFEQTWEEARQRSVAGEWSEAVTAYETMAKTWPELYVSNNLDYGHALALLNVGKPDAASALFVVAGQRDSWLRPYAHDRAAKCYDRLDKPLLAEAELAQAMLADAPGLTSGTLLLRRVDWLIAGGALNRAESLLARISTKNAAAEWKQAIMLRQARLAREQKQHSRAIALAQACMEVKSASQAARDALKLAEELEKAHPKLSVATALRNPFYRGEVLFDGGRFVEAAKYYSIYLKCYPTGRVADECLFKLGRCHQRLEENSKAVQYYDRLLREYPDADNAYLARIYVAGIRRMDGQYEEAEAILRRGLTRPLSPNQKARIYYHIGLTWEPRDKDKAREAYDLGVKASPRGAFAAVNLWASAWLSLPEHPQAALASFDQLIALRNESKLYEEARYMRAILLRGEGRISEAFRALTELVRDEPRSYMGVAAAEELADPQFAQHINQARAEVEATAGMDLPATELLDRLTGILPVPLWPEKVRTKVARTLVNAEGWRDLLAAKPLGPLPPRTAATKRPAFDSSDSGHLLQLGRELLALGDMEAASWLLAVGQRRGGKDDISLLLAVLDARVAAGNYSGAIALIKDAIKHLPAAVDLMLLPVHIVRYQFPYAYKDQVVAAANAANIDPLFMLAIARTESTFQATVTSNAGARGLMQIMPGTGAELAKEIGLQDYSAATLSDPQVNLRLGAAYLAKLLERYDGDLARAAAAYNGGSTNVNRWQATVTGPDPVDFILRIGFEETRQYAQSVLFAYNIYRHLYGEQQ